MFVYIDISQWCVVFLLMMLNHSVRVKVYNIRNYKKAVIVKLVVWTSILSSFLIYTHESVSKSNDFSDSYDGCTSGFRLCCGLWFTDRCIGRRPCCCFRGKSGYRRWRCWSRPAHELFFVLKYLPKEN